jgi:hypothetical protein
MSPAPEGAAGLEELAVSLKRCPDMNAQYNPVAVFAEANALMRNANTIHSAKTH